MIERLIARLKTHHRVALDTSIFIYHIEGNARYSALANAIFAWLERPGRTAVASTVALTELLVSPYRQRNQPAVDAIYGLLVTYPNLEWVAPELEVADLAARLRAMHDLKISDALLAATAVRSGATLFITNDRVFRRVAEFDSLILDDLL